jgi:type II secretory pathway pseudopilin PulG
MLMLKSNQTMKRFKPASGRGDTLVEVIIGIAVIGTVMATAFVSTTHSLQVGTDAGNRNRALGFAQQQVEQIKYAEQQGKIAPYTANTAPFCVDPATGPPPIVVGSNAYCDICINNSNQPQSYIDPSKASCPSGTQNQYSVSESFDSTTNIFTVNAQWPAPNGSGSDQLVLYYKLPG